jgi:hypothetical protein
MRARVRRDGERGAVAVELAAPLVDPCLQLRGRRPGEVLDGDVGALGDALRRAPAEEHGEEGHDRQRGAQQAGEETHEEAAVKVLPGRAQVISLDVPRAGGPAAGPRCGGREYGATAGWMLGVHSAGSSTLTEPLQHRGRALRRHARSSGGDLGHRPAGAPRRHRRHTIVGVAQGRRHAGGRRGGRGLVADAARSGAEIIAEGIETAEQAMPLVEQGVRLGRGHAPGRPRPAGLWAAAPTAPG